jgi:beta-lactamase regulating signal transducer with metallopeptidase domain
VVVVWLSGSAVIAALQLVRLVRFRRLVAQGQQAPRWLRRQVKALAARLGVRPPATLMVPGVATPAVWGLGRPKLLWPAALLEHLSRSSRRGVLVHELAHLRRRDHWAGGLILLGEGLWWWNPLFWYVRRQLRLQAELACDAWVVSLLPEERRPYAEALLDVTQLVCRTAAPAPAVGMTGGARHALERRLTMIMREQVPCRLPLLGLAAAGLLAFIALPGWSQAPGDKVEKSEKSEKSQPAPTVLQGELIDLRMEVGDILTEVVLDPAQPAQTAADRDRRLQKLEEQVEALLKEVKALRAGAKKPAVAARLDDLNASRSRVARLRLAAEPLQVRRELSVVRLATADEQELALSRATYKLPQAKAEALAKFLREQVKAPVMETKVEGDSLTVTTTPEAQKAIKGLVGLIQGKQTTLNDTQRLRRHGVEWRLDPEKPH